METRWIRNGYFFDPYSQERGLKLGASREFKEFFRKYEPIRAGNTTIDERGIALVKIPKTGTQTLVELFTHSFLVSPDSERRNLSFREVLSNRLCWNLWPNLHMLPRIAGKSPWIVGGRTFLPEQLLALEAFWSLFPRGDTPASSTGPLGGQGFKLLIGHWPWTYDPDVYSRVMISDNPHTVTIMRDPAKRAFSSYHYNLRRIGETAKASIKDFERFLHEDYDEDFYCRWFSWPSSPDTPNYENAEKNLRSRIDTVGVTERYADLVSLCHARFGLRQDNLVVNKSETTFSLNDLPTSIRNLLNRRTEKDRSLYDVALKRFEQDFKMYSQKDGRKV